MRKVVLGLKKQKITRLRSCVASYTEDSSGDEIFKCECTVSRVNGKRSFWRTTMKPDLAQLVLASSFDTFLDKLEHRQYQQRRSDDIRSIRFVAIQLVAPTEQSHRLKYPYLQHTELFERFLPPDGARCYHRRG